MLETEKQFIKKPVLFENSLKEKQIEKESGEKKVEFSKDKKNGLGEINLGIAAIEEDKERLAEIDRLEKESGLNLDKTQEEISKEISVGEAALEEEKARLEREKARAEYEKSVESITPEVREKAREEILKNLDENSAEDVKDALSRIRDHVGSPGYLNKLQIEFDGNLEKAQRAQKIRMTYLDFIGFYFIDRDSLNREFIRGKIDSSKNWMPKWLAVEMELFKLSPMKVLGFYNPERHEIKLKKNRENDIIPTHEILHASTRGNIEIPERTINLLFDSYKAIGNKKRDDYLSNTSERLDRKQMLDLELERLEIKKYEEKFTNEHYLEMMQHFSEGAFSFPVEEFIQTTKPEYFERIMNEIAVRKDDKDRNIEQA